MTWDRQKHCTVFVLPIISVLHLCPWPCRNECLRTAMAWGREKRWKQKALRVHGCCGALAEVVLQSFVPRSICLPMQRCVAPFDVALV